MIFQTYHEKLPKKSSLTKYEDMIISSYFGNNKAWIYKFILPLAKRKRICYNKNVGDKNTLGDIIAIRNEDGDIVATYEYDAWGNVTVMDEYGRVNTSSTFIGNINPFRYRGYYYDTETGFYYLQTRYYDPTICRFINADNYELVAELSQTVGQLNLYAYANNNPIMLTDETGESVSLALLIGSFLYGAIVSVVSQGATKGWDNIDLVEASVDGAFTALSVGLASTGIGLGMSVGLGGTMGAVQYGIKVAFFDEKFSWDGLALSVVCNAFGGALSGAGAQNAKALGDAISPSGLIVSSGLISGIRNFTSNSTFIKTVNEKLIGGVIAIGISTAITAGLTTLRSLYLVN